jgi:hypothetical protein
MKWPTARTVIRNGKIWLISRITNIKNLSAAQSKEKIVMQINNT